MTTPHPIFGLLRRIEDDTARCETLTLINYLGVKTVEGLAQYSKPYLTQNDVTSETLGILEQVLQTEYQLSFPLTPAKPLATERPIFPQVSKPRMDLGLNDHYVALSHLRGPQKRSNASGAPPSGILSSVPNHPDLATYLKR